jgi:hypothetical protein
VLSFTSLVPAWFADLLGSLGFLGALSALVTMAALRVTCGDTVRRHHRVMELEHSNAQLPQLTSGVERIRTDLAQARRISEG